MSALDTSNGFFREIDQDLAPFLEALDRNKAVIRTPKDIISLEARAMVVAVEQRFTKFMREMGDTFNILDLVKVIEADVSGVKFDSHPLDERIGFFTVPGVTERIHSEDLKRRLVLPYIDFEGASEEALASLGHYHIGARVLDANGQERVLHGEYADTWASGIEGISFEDPAGLVWSDLDGRLKIHSHRDGVRIGPHGTYDNYAAVKSLGGLEKTAKGTPQFYLSAYYGGIDMRATQFPAVRYLTVR